MSSHEIRIRIRVGKVELEGELNDSETAGLVSRALPLRAKANRWGDELYFEIPVSAEAEAGARDVMAVGELAYWPPGKAFCIFWGPTPASSGDEPRAASNVNPIGRLHGDVSALGASRSGIDVVIERA